MMDVRDGRIYRLPFPEEVSEQDRQFLIPMEVPPTPLQRARGKVKRNDNCPCGSGKKFKKCCMQLVPIKEQEE
jgi:hypothetical protein